MLSSTQIREFQQMILTWYKINKRDLPWRKDRDPYHILISEIMLQQTQVSRVIPKYEEWMKKFPTVESLTKATTQDVLLYWSGLGYNRRALYLKKLAEELTTKVSKDSNVSKVSDLHWPQTEKELMQLSGIGKYTASAILCFAFNKQISVVDTNIRKVILVHFASSLRESMIKQAKTKKRLPRKQSLLAMTDKKIQQIAQQLLPKGNAYDWNQALMDYAAAELKKQKISIPKQSKFKDSDRYYRGQIIKLLTTNKKLFISDLQKTFTNVEKKRLEKIIAGLMKDKFIQRLQDKIILSS